MTHGTIVRLAGGIITGLLLLAVAGFAVSVVVHGDPLKGLGR